MVAPSGRAVLAVKSARRASATCGGGSAPAGGLVGTVVTSVDGAGETGSDVDPETVSPVRVGGGLWVKASTQKATAATTTTTRPAFCHQAERVPGGRRPSTSRTVPGSGLRGFSRADPARAAALPD